MSRRHFIYLMCVAALIIPFGIVKMIMRVVAPRFNFDTVAIPLIRNIMPSLCMADIMAVQPMMGPVGKVFYMDYKHDDSAKKIF